MAFTDIESLFRKEIQDFIAGGCTEDHVDGLGMLGSSNQLVLMNVFKPKVLRNLLRELANMEFAPKETDSYKFEQSTDFSCLDGGHFPMCVKLQHIFEKNLKKLVERVFKGKFPGNVSMSASRYCYTDFLLCHDDQVEDRKIAYIYYLNKDWTYADGGTLDFFTIDERGLPDQIGTRVLPEENKLVMFAVNSTSFHQVSEILSKDKTRISISGWFTAGEEVKIVKTVLCDKVPKYLPVVRQRPDANFFFQSDYEYLRAELSFYAFNAQAMHLEILENQSLLLQDFLSEALYNDVLTELQSNGIEWISVGSAARRCYEVAKPNRQRGDCCNLSALLSKFRGTIFLKLLSQIVMKKIDASKVEYRNDIAVSTEVIRLKHGSYSLVVDGRMYNNDQSSVDLWLFFNSDHITCHTGGDIGYIDMSTDLNETPMNNTIHCQQPPANGLFIVARSPKSYPFITYINDRVKEEVHYAIHIKYLVEFDRNDLIQLPKEMYILVQDNV